MNNARAKKQEQDAIKLESRRSVARAANKSLVNAREKMSGYKTADQKISDLKKKKAELQAQKTELKRDTYSSKVVGNYRFTWKDGKPIGNSLKIKNIEGQISSLDRQIEAAQKQKQKEQQKLYKTKKKGLF